MTGDVTGDVTKCAADTLDAVPPLSRLGSGSAACGGGRGLGSPGRGPARLRGMRRQCACARTGEARTQRRTGSEDGGDERRDVLGEDPRHAVRAEQRRVVAAHVRAHCLASLKVLAEPAL